MEVALRRTIYLFFNTFLQLITAILDFVANIYYWLRENQYIPTQNRAIMITGCDSGFGQATATYFAQKGVKVYAGCLTKEGIGFFDGEANVSAFQLDITQDRSVERGVETVRKGCEKEGTDLWCFIANAGVASVMCPIEWTRISDYEQTAQVNQIGTFRSVLAFLPMIKKSQGRIVIMTSIAGHVVGRHWTPYHASKYGVVAIADAMTFEFAQHGIRVITVAPLFYPTQFADIWKTFRERYEQLPKHLKDEWPEEVVEELIAERKSYVDRIARGNKVSEIPEVYYHAAFGAAPRYTYFLGRRHPRLLIFGRMPDFIRAWLCTKEVLL